MPQNGRGGLGTLAHFLRPYDEFESKYLEGLIVVASENTIMGRNGKIQRITPFTVAF